MFSIHTGWHANCTTGFGSKVRAMEYAVETRHTRTLWLLGVLVLVLTLAYASALIGAYVAKHRPSALELTADTEPAPAPVSTSVTRPSPLGKPVVTSATRQ